MNLLRCPYAISRTPTCFPMTGLNKKKQNQHTATHRSCLLNQSWPFVSPVASQGTGASRCTDASTATGSTRGTSTRRCIGRVPCRRSSTPKPRWRRPPSCCCGTSRCVRACVRVCVCVCVSSACRCIQTVKHTLAHRQTHVHTDRHTCTLQHTNERLHSCC